ncbi:MAG: class I SAM-dependent methyltransferase, partial [Sporomusaceae bacterium]|nr:class I SAM-dependent methyltransferase [Sporomusaceae bacterium]
VVNQKRFQAKWGFVPLARGNILVSLLGEADAEKEARVLEIGCGYGKTLLKIKELFPRAEFFGIEANPNAAKIAEVFAAIKVGDPEKIAIDYPDNYFDYILLSDSLEHLVDPWEMLAKIKRCLKPGGCLLASIPNIMHFTIIAQLLAGEWNYVDSGILDKTHLRFFTLATTKKMFQEIGYTITETREITPGYQYEESFLEYLRQKVPAEKSNELLVEQYLIKATHNFL